MPTTELRRDSRGLPRIVAVVVVLAVVLGVGGWLLTRLGVGPLPDPEGCVAEVGGQQVELTTAQARNAAVIAAVGLRREMPARAVSIALATAFQESKLRNLDHGDRDSLGLFQQRPSQGWGTPAQLQDPVYAANAFYDALAEVDGYRDMRITEAAQAVQRSGFPEAYEQHASGARALASALTGWSPGAFSCVVDPDGDLAFETIRADGLTPRAARVRRALEAAYGDLSLGGFAPGGVTTGHMRGSAHYEGRAIDVFVRPVTAENRRRGWSMAHFLVAHATALHVDHVIFDGRIWSAGRHSEEGWRPYRPRSAEGADAATRAVLLHRDHVHVDVVAGD
jgi:hypothetical protein